MYCGEYVTPDSSDSNYSSDKDEISESNKFRNSDEKNDKWVGQDELRVLTEIMEEVCLTPTNDPDQGATMKKMQQEKDELLREIKRLQEDNAKLASLKPEVEDLTDEKLEYPSKHASKGEATKDSLALLQKIQIKLEAKDEEVAMAKRSAEIAGKKVAAAARKIKHLQDRLKYPACHDVKDHLYLAMTCGHKI